MEVTPDRDMEEEVCKYKQGAASASQRVQGLFLHHPQLPLTVCRLQQIVHQATFECPGLPGKSDRKKCSRSPTGQKTKAPAHPQPRRGRDKQRLAPPGPGISQVACLPSAPSNPCCHSHLGGGGRVWGDTEQRAWDVAMGCWAGSGGKEKSFGMPTWKRSGPKTRAEVAQSKHMMAARACERPAGTCRKRSHLTANKSPSRLVP